MAAVRRHWRAIAFNVLLLAGALLGGAYYLGTGPVSRAAPSAGTGAAAIPPKRIDPLTYTRVQEVRESLCLTDTDLAAMGCSQASAERVLATLLGWYEANKIQVEQAAQAEIDARRLLREASRKANVGPKNATSSTQLASARAALSTVVARRAQIQGEAASGVTQLLTAAQAGVWTSARANAKAPARYRYAAGLTAQESKALEAALRKGSGAATAAERSLLVGGKKAALDAARANAAIHAAAVADAVGNVLPLPPELQELGLLE